MNQAAFDRFGASRRWMLIPAGIFVVGAILTVGALKLAAAIDREISQNRIQSGVLIAETDE